MKDEFCIFKEFSEDEIGELWGKAIFITDANVLLNFYRYTFETREAFTRILDKLSQRIWIPHQVALEFYSNRVTVINKQKVAYNKTRESIKKLAVEFTQKLEEELKDYKKRHPVINIKEISNKVEGVIDNLCSELEEEENKHPDYINNDEILRKIERLFESKVGESFDQEKLEDIFKEGEGRYAGQFPPGYKDLKDKKGKQKYIKDLVIKSEYGDLIVWKQIIDFAKENKKPIIFITDDTKDDWWHKDHGMTIGPRIELLNEFYTETSQRFYMYESHRFIEFANKYLDEKVSKEVVQEIREVGENSVSYPREYVQAKGRATRINKDDEYEIVEDETGQLSLAYKSEQPLLCQIGDTVLHKRYGLGVIKSIYERTLIGTDRRTTFCAINFGNGLTKHIILDSRFLEIIESDDDEA